MSTLLCLTPNPSIAEGILNELQACGCQKVNLSLVACARPMPMPMPIPNDDQSGSPATNRDALAAATGIRPVRTLAVRAGTVSLTVPGLGPCLASGLARGVLQDQQGRMRAGGSRGHPARPGHGRGGSRPLVGLGP